MGMNLLLCERDLDDTTIHVYSDRVRLMWLTSFPVGPKSKRWQCSLRNVSWRTTCRRRRQLSAVWLFCIDGCVLKLHACEHLLPLVVSKRDPLCRHFKMDNSRCRRGVHGKCQRRGFLNCLMSCQWLQRNRTQVPHITCYTTAETHRVTHMLNSGWIICDFFVCVRHETFHSLTHAGCLQKGNKYCVATETGLLFLTLKHISPLHYSLMTTVSNINSAACSFAVQK